MSEEDISRNGESRTHKVLLAKPGLDGHDRGVKVVALALREAGFEVIYTGLRQSVDAIASIAIEEDVDVIGLSILSGSHVPICTKMKERITAAGLQDKLWIVGGNIPVKDHGILKDMGVKEVFPTGTPYERIVEYIKRELL